MMHSGIIYMIQSAIVHGVIYDLIYKLMRHLTTGQAIGVVAMVIFAIIGIRMLFSDGEMQD